MQLLNLHLLLAFCCCTVQVLPIVLTLLQPQSVPASEHRV
jgi:hypothetical protein